jgi:ubiquinone/menaquinone biosynthesis C-methylase UbiE
MKKHEHGGMGSGGFVDVIKVISLLVKKDEVFVDIGCGPGDYLIRASKLTKRITGIDTDKESIHKVKKIGLNGILADATKKIPLQDSSVDSMLMSNVLHGFVVNNTEKQVISEIKRVLKHNGKLGVVEFKKDSVRGPEKEIKISDKELEDILKKYGFIKYSYHDVGESNYFMIFKNK